ncbi:MAG TPA: hypothetical protein VE053_08655 [Allosphingosinicella sp.]|nr:hypothetical protein [Allosphingosinicella sp.]
MRFAPLRLGRPALLFGLAAAMVGASASGAGKVPLREINSLAREMSPRISQCLIRREPALIDRWLRTLPGSTEEERLFRAAEPRFSPCFGLPFGGNGAIWLPRYDKAGMRAALVRALLQARRRDLPAAAPPGAGSAWYSSPQAPARTAEDAAAIVAADLGACLASRHWGNVVAIVRAVDPVAENSIAWGYRDSRAARDREAATVDSELSKVIPSLSACVPAGAKVRVNRLRLRRLLEEAAFQMAKGDRDSYEFPLHR